MTDENIAGFFLAGWYVFDNFAPFQIEWRGKLYSTAEHAYQAAHFFATAPEIADMIRSTGSPREASDVANATSAQEDPDWKDKRLAVMEEIVRAKLVQHPYIQQVLLNTGSKTIVEMNNTDAFWGWGDNHRGRNELGKIWMKLRSELQSSQ